MTASERRCEECGRNYPLPPATVCAPCLKRLSDLARCEESNPPKIKKLGNSTQAEAQAQAQVQDQAKTTSPSVLEVPEPGCRADDGPELYDLLRAHREGNLDPVDVTLGDMPSHAGHVARAIAEHMRLLWGLRFAVNDERPLPYARSLAVAAGVAPNLSSASRALNRLVRYGVIDHVGSLPPLKRGLDGTKLYAPPAAAVAELRRAA